MQRQHALLLLRFYSRIFATHGADEVLRGLSDRFPVDGSERKAMRWLGFAQGAAYALRLFVLDDIKQHSKQFAELHEIAVSKYIQRARDYARSWSASSGRPVAVLRGSASDPEQQPRGVQHTYFTVELDDRDSVGGAELICVFVDGVEYERQLTADTSLQDSTTKKEEDTGNVKG